MLATPSHSTQVTLLDPVRFPGGIKVFAREICRNDLLNFGRLHFFFPDSRLALDLSTDKTLKEARFDRHFVRVRGAGDAFVCGGGGHHSPLQIASLLSSMKQDNANIGCITLNKALCVCVRVLGGGGA
jgi:hypothetical protein